MTADPDDRGAQPAIDPELATAVRRAVDGLRDEAVEALRAAVRIASINPSYPGQDAEALRGKEGEVARMVAEIHRAAGATAELIAFAPDRENCISVLPGAGGEGARTLLFNGHLDVVPPGEPNGWTGGDPFSGELRDGAVWGRGSADMKAGVLAQAFSSRALAEVGIRLAGDLLLHAVVGEEQLEHEIGTSAALAHGPRPDAAIVAEPSSVPGSPLAIAPAAAGAINFRVTVEGRSAHAGLRGTSIRAGGEGAAAGVNAIDKAVLIHRALLELEQDWAQSKSHALFEPGFFSLLPGVMFGSPAGVMTPTFLVSEAWIEYLGWHPPGMTRAEAMAEVERQVELAAALDPWLREHPPRVVLQLDVAGVDVPTDHPLCVALGEAHEAAAAGTRFAGRPNFAAFRAASDATWIDQAGIPVVVYGPGDIGRAHADDEYVMVDEYLCAIETFAHAAIRWCGVAE